MSTRFVMLDIVEKAEEKMTRRWVSGVGKDAVFSDHSDGWWVTFVSGHESIYVGPTSPGLKRGDHVRRIVEKVE